VEVTSHTIQGRLLFRPSPAVNEIVTGVLGRAQRLFQPEVCAFVVMSNHWHLLLCVTDAEQLALFMQYFSSNVAREIVRLTGWTDKVFEVELISGNFITMNREGRPSAENGRRTVPFTVHDE